MVRRNFLVSASRRAAVLNFASSFTLLMTVIALFAMHERSVSDKIASMSLGLYCGTYLVTVCLLLAAVTQHAPKNSLRPTFRWMIASTGSFCLQAIGAYVVLRAAGTL